MIAPALRVDIVSAGFVEHPPSRRDRVLDLVLRGRVTPDRAEAWARDNGEGAFAEEPDAARFDPMAEIDWSPAMTTAWILRRTPDAVRRAWGAFLAECWLWQPIDMTVPRPASPGGCRRYCGYQLGQPEIPSAASALQRAVAIGAPLIMLVDEVEREMRHSLRSGRLAAFPRGAVDPIPPRLWADLSPFSRPISRRGQHDAVYGGDGEVLFTGVKLERDAVVALWPAPATVPAPRSSGRPSLEALWLPEFERREALGVNGGVEATAGALRDWLHGEIQAGRVMLPANHPMPSDKTIARSVRERRKGVNDQKQVLRGF